MTPAEDRAFDSSCLSEAAQAAWDQVLDLEYSSTDSLTGARAIALAVSDPDGFITRYVASIKARRAKTALAGAAASPDTLKGADYVIRVIEKLRCAYGKNRNGAQWYAYPTWFPTFGTGCTSDAILNFFNVNKTAVVANNVQYIYNSQQGTSQVNADLITATFPGFQAVLAGTATSGSSQTSTSSSNGTTSKITTDSVSTTVSKIENGGDFNIRFPVPVLFHQGTAYVLDGKLIPNVGFNINGFGPQDTITQSSEYSVNVPLEFYAQTNSIDPTADGTVSAILFLDMKPSAELISTQLAQAIGLTSSRGFFLGQASAGIEFNQDIRISFQYFYGPEQIYTPVIASTPVASRIGGLHLAVSFSPTSKQKK